MVKKVLAIFLCALMLTAVAPINAFAGEDTVIESADITLKSGIAGLTVDDYKRIVKINSEGLIFDDFNGFDAIDAYEKIGDDEFSDDEFFGEFVAGETYKLYLYFVPAEGYALPESLDDIELTYDADGAEFNFDVIGNDYLDDNPENDTYEYYEVCFYVTVAEQGFFAKLMTSINSFFETIVNFFMNLFAY